MQGTCIDLGPEGLGQYGTIIDIGGRMNGFIPNPDAINPVTKNPYTVGEALTTLGGLTGGSQAVPATFAGIPVPPGSALNLIQASGAGSHDWFADKLWGSYDALGNANSSQSAAFRNFMAAIDLPLAAPFAWATLNTQMPGLNAAAMNAIRNSQFTAPVTPKPVVLVPSPIPLPIRP